MGHALPLSLMQKDGVRGGSGSSGLQQGRGGSGAKGHASVVVIDHEAEELIKRAQVGQGPPPQTHTHTQARTDTHTQTHTYTHTRKTGKHYASHAVCRFLGPHEHRNQKQ